MSDPADQKESYFSETEGSGDSVLNRCLRWISLHLLPNGQKINRLEAEVTLRDGLIKRSQSGYIVCYGTQVIQTSKNIENLIQQDVIEEIGELIEGIAYEARPQLSQFIRGLIQAGEAFEETFPLLQSDEQIKLEGQPLDKQKIPPHFKNRILQQTHDTMDQYGWTSFWVTSRALPVVDPEAEERARSQKMKEFFDALNIPVWQRDEEAKLVWGNRAYRQELGVSEQNIEREQPEILGNKQQLARGLAKRAMRSSQPASEKYHTIYAGQRRLLEVTEIGLENQPDISDESRRGTVGYATDLTAMERTEEELERFKASNSEILRSLTTGIAIFSAEKDLSFYNEAFAQIFHLEEAWLNNQPRINDILEKMRHKRRLPEQANFKEYKEQWISRFTTLIDQYEEMLHLPDGTAVRVVTVPHPMGGLFMTFEDVTSRLELEANYNTLIAVQQETLANLAEGIVVFGTDGRLQLYNKVYAAMWNLDQETLKRHPHISDVVTEMEALFPVESWEENAEILLNTGLMREERIGRLFLDDDRVFEYVTVPLPDGAVLSRFLDVTDTLRVERALLEKNAALEEAERLKLDFLANVSYQLRTPLNAMMGFAEVLNNEYFGSINERQREYTTGMIEAGDKLISLINDILDLSTIEAGYFELKPEEFDLYEMVKSVYDLTEEWARQYNIKLRLECPKTAGRMKGDERRLKQALLNLVSNAIKFTPAKGRITIKIVRFPGYVDFVIRDSGIGIGQKDQEKIFTPFVQVRKKNEGAGLGLTLVKKVVELHGGSVEVDSAIGQGTKITCRVPLRAKSKGVMPKSADRVIQ
mgnify:CR=1 FL=1